MDPFWKLVIISTIAGVGYLIYQAILAAKEHDARRCQHEWEVIRESDVSRTGGGKIGKHYIMKCKKCGDLTNRELTV